MSTISDKQLEYVGECTTALDMTKRFDKMYTTHSTALQIICREKINKIKLTNYNAVEEFFVEFEKTINDFKTAGGKPDESEKMRYRRAVQRKANLEVTGEEKPKTRLRRRKANKRLGREKKPVCTLPYEEKPVSLVSVEKSQFAPSPDEKLQQTAFCT